MQHHSFPSPVRTRWAANDTVHAWYLPPPEAAAPAPALVLLHGYRMAKDHLLPVAQYLRRMGYGVWVPDLPYHGQRTLSGNGAPGPSPARDNGQDPASRPGLAGLVRAGLVDPVSLAEAGAGDSGRLPFGGDLDAYCQAVGQAIEDMRLGLDWLAARPEIDPARLGVGGYSLGGVLAAALMGIEPRFRAGVALMGGGDFAELILSSSIGEDVRRQLLAAGWSKTDLREAFRPYDPITHGARVRNLLMINGRRDPVIPRSCVDRLWQAVRPGSGNRLVWGPWTHVPPPGPVRHHVLAHLRRHLPPAARALRPAWWRSLRRAPAAGQRTRS